MTRPSQRLDILAQAFAPDPSEWVFDKVIDSGSDSSKWGKCVCGQLIRYLYVMNRARTNDVNILGSTCVGESIPVLREAGAVALVKSLEKAIQARKPLTIKTCLEAMREWVVNAPYHRALDEVSQGIQDWPTTERTRFALSRVYLIGIVLGFPDLPTPCDSVLWCIDSSSSGEEACSIIQNRRTFELMEDGCLERAKVAIDKYVSEQRSARKNPLECGNVSYRRNSDDEIRRLERAVKADSKDLIAYEAMLAAKIRTGVPIEDDPKTPPYNTDKYAILLNARVRVGVTTQPRVAMAARLGHSASMLVSPGLTNATLLEAFGIISDRREAVSFACDCAERALIVFERVAPGNRRPRLSIEAIQAWIESPSKRTVEAVLATEGLCRNAILDAITVRDNFAVDAIEAVHANHAIDAVEAVVRTCQTVFVSQNYIAYATRAVRHAYDAYAFFGDNYVSTIRSWQRELLAKYLLGEAP